MSRVDHGLNALGRKKGGEASDAAEAPGPRRDRRRRGIGRRARERKDCADLRLLGDPPRQRARFRRAAENDEAKAVQGAAP